MCIWSLETGACIRQLIGKSFRCFATLESEHAVQVMWTWSAAFASRRSTSSLDPMTSLQVVRRPLYAIFRVVEQSVYGNGRPVRRCCGLWDTIAECFASTSTRAKSSPARRMIRSGSGTSTSMFRNLEASQVFMFLIMAMIINIQTHHEIMQPLLPDLSFPLFETFREARASELRRHRNDSFQTKHMINEKANASYVGGASE